MFVSAVYIRLVATIDVLLHIGCLFWTYGASMCISHFFQDDDHSGGSLDSVFVFFFDLTPSYENGLWILTSYE